MNVNEVMKRIGVALGAKQAGTPVEVGEPALKVTAIAPGEGLGMMAAFSLRMLPAAWQPKDRENLTVADLEALRPIVGEMFAPPDDVEPEERARFDVRPKVLPVIEACILEIEGNVS